MSGNLASDQGSVMVAPKGNDLGGALSTANKVPYVMEKWNVSDPDAYVVWNMALVDIVEESTCAGFIKSSIPTAADMPAVRRAFGTRNAVRGETEAAPIPTLIDMEAEWRSHDALLFRILLKSVILDKRMGMHVAIHFHPKKQGHAFYAYL